MGNSALELSLNEGHDYTIRHDQIILSENKIIYILLYMKVFIKKLQILLIQKKDS